MAISLVMAVKVAMMAGAGVREIRSLHVPGYFFFFSFCLSHSFNEMAQQVSHHVNFSNAEFLSLTTPPPEPILERSYNITPGPLFLVPVSIYPFAKSDARSICSLNIAGKGNYVQHIITLDTPPLALSRLIYVRPPHIL